MKIIVTGERLEQYSSSIFGNIYVQLGDGFCFPDNGWTDFVDRVLSMWRSDLEKLVVQETDQALLHFMDGPYALLIDRIKGNHAICKFVRSGETLVDIRSFETDLLEFRKNIHEAIRQLVKLAQKHSVHSDELQYLSTKI